MGEQVSSSGLLSLDRCKLLRIRLIGTVCTRVLDVPLTKSSQNRDNFRRKMPVGSECCSKH